MKTKKSLQSVHNGLMILHLFSTEKSTWGVTEISEELSLSKSTVSRLVSELVEEGFLEKNGMKYQLGVSVLCLSGVITSHSDIYSEAKPALETLAAKVNETAHISILEDSNITYLHKVECSQPIELLSSIGKTNPATCTSSGKVILAYQNDQVLNKILHYELVKCGPKSVTDKQILLNQLKEIKKQGYAICVNEMFDEVVSIAAPVRDFTGEVIAAVSIVGPLYRMKQIKFDDYIREVSLASNEISDKLGFLNFS
ncbi:IclR family transcriptional regulator [Alkalihalophilus pseudofirmus]|uniref:IclR family transcriptional regulator n=1 Tax=Alkalihalophilus pseudofirmus TaxID=79885 RepID=A0AAJ2NMJ0_ALKPS|nr:IclR family transcriptional regulator [Alkalihalophilus pseudofirmus]MDV2883715.1 IclR family transcriptional regulator [Alkalihalophilus pseudofirmus]